MTLAQKQNQADLDAMSMRSSQNNDTYRSIPDQSIDPNVIPVVTKKGTVNDNQVAQISEVNPTRKTSELPEDKEFEDTEWKYWTYWKLKN